MSRGRCGPELTDRDLAIIHFVFEHRIASREQIGIRFFEGSTRQAVEKRLLTLLSAKYLDKHSALWNRRLITVYNLGPKGAATVTETYRYQVLSPICKSDSPLHDLMLVNLRTRLEKTSMLSEYMTENVLQCSEGLEPFDAVSAMKRINSDGMLKIKTKFGLLTVAFEFEGSAKSQARYVRKIREYYMASEIEAVFYVSGSRYITNLIRQAEAEVLADLSSKIFICSLDEIQNSKDPLSFTSRSTNRFLLA